MTAVTIPDPLTNDTAQRLTYKLALALGVTDARMNDTFQRLLYRIAILLGAPARMDDMEQMLLYRIGLVLGAPDVRIDDMVQRLLWKIALHYGVTTEPGAVATDDIQRLLWKISTVVYFTPKGTAPAKATTPSPANAATGVALSPTLSWVGDGTETSFLVYFDGVLVSTQAGTSYTPAAMSYYSAHTWRIDSVNDFGTTTGDTWSFTTMDDPAVTAFVTATGGLTAGQTAAIRGLVASLKALPAVGTKYWNRDILIYPLVGGNATAHKVNLKSPGTYDLVFGSGVTHSAGGIKGDGTANGYADTVYVPAAPLTVNDTRAFMYVDLAPTIDARFYYGVQPPSNGWYVHRWRTGSPSCNYLASDLTYTNYAPGASDLGAWIIQRFDASTKQVSYKSALLTGASVAPFAFPNRSFYLLAANANGTVSAPGNGRISAWSLGTKLLNDTEWQEYRGIWETYQTALGRAH